MSYQPYDRNPSGIVFFGTSASDQLFESNSNFTYNGSTLNVPNITISDGGNIGSESDPDAISIDSNGDVSFSQDISIAGNLTVNGTTTTVNSTVVTIEDPIIILGSGSPSADDNKDRGISFNYYSGSAKTGFFGYDDSTGKFTFIPDATITSEVVSGAAGTIVANLEGNATTATTALDASGLTSAVTVALSNQLSGSQTFQDGGDTCTINASLTAASITGQTATTDAQDADLLLLYDNSASALRKITRANFVSDLGIMDNFIVSGDAGAAQTISDGNTLNIAGGSGVLTTASATDVLTIDIKTTNGIEISSDSVGLASSVAGAGLGYSAGVLSVNASTGLTVSGDDVILASTVAGSGLNYAAGVLNIGAGTGMSINSTTVGLANTSVSAGSYGSATQVGSFTVDAQGRLTGASGVNINITASQVNDFNTASESAIFTAANFVDGTTIDFTVTTGASVTAEVKDNSITEAKLNRTVDAWTAATGIASSDVTLINATSNSVVLTLPENGGTIGEGRIMVVKRTDNSANTVTISRQTADTIDGATSVQLYHRYETMTFVSDGADWFII